ncbi:MAG: hypothetical protein U1C74_02270 [Phenylobacterium sp.]|nr:hypothetical protein [Phenylobacterium sp.]
MTLINDVTDPIKPTIEHHVNEVLDSRGRQEQVYNFIVYHFEAEGGYGRAQAYLHKPTVVEMYGPFRSRASVEPVQAPALIDAAKTYLKRRFKSVRTRSHP